ncbi:integrase [Methanohalophilus levihalophilus]|nr:integrase [Methanohalophilus levihalophilus]
MEVHDIDIENMQIRLKKKRKRSRDIVYFDEELKEVLIKYLEYWNDYAKNTSYLWLNKYYNNKMNKDRVNEIIGLHAEKLGYHDPNGPLENRVTAHCFRHFYTTELYKAGMDPEFIKYLRGDSLEKESWQIYNHINPQRVRDDYLNRIPALL